MPLHLHVGPPASGKTHSLLELAANTSSPLHALWWVGLPHQRERTQYRAATALARDNHTRALPRFEFLTLQQLLYRLIETHDDIPPPLAAPGLQLAHAAIAVQRAFARPPSPGEAHLYLHGIRDVKRAHLAPNELPDTPTGTQLARVIHQYEAVRAGRWADYEDYRLRALELLANPNQHQPSRTIIIDGFLEFPPADLRLIEALAKRTATHLTLEHDIPTLQRDTTTHYQPRAPRQRQHYRHSNPLEETRWVLRAIKRDLHARISPHELAIIAPPEAHHAFEALAETYGVPLRSSRPPTLAQTRAGRLLQRLLAFTHDLGPDALRAIPQLAPLARALSERNLHGSEAAERVATTLGLHEPLTRWREHLALPTRTEQANAWITRALDTLEELDPELPHHQDWGELREQLRLRGGEASQIDLQRLATWWPLLLEQYSDPSERPHGVALLEPDAATGLQYQRTYLVRASVGAYEHAITEDYFVSDDERVPRDPRQHGLPKRVSDRSDRLAAHLLERAHTLIISYPAADQDAPLENDPRLLTQQTTDAPPLPAGNTHETRTTLTPPPPRDMRVRIDPHTNVRLRDLQRLHDTRRGFRAHFERLTRDRHQTPPWLELIGALTHATRLTNTRLTALQRDYPNHARWLTQHQQRLKRLALGVRIPHPSGAHALVHGLRRHHNTLEMTHFTASDSDPDSLRERLSKDWERRQAAHALENAFALPITAVAWPIGGEPLTLGELHVKDEPRAIENAMQRYRAGDAHPNNGFHCRTCPLTRLCPTN